MVLGALRCKEVITLLYSFFHWRKVFALPFWLGYIRTMDNKLGADAVFTESPPNSVLLSLSFLILTPSQTHVNCSAGPDSHPSPPTHTIVPLCPSVGLSHSTSTPILSPPSSSLLSPVFSLTYTHHMTLPTPLITLILGWHLPPSFLPYGSF